VVLNGGLAPVLAQLELWLGLRDHDEDETALSGSRGGAVMLLDRLRVTKKSRNSLGGWDGILRLAIRGEGWFERSERVISRNVVRRSRWIHFSPARQGCHAFRPSLHFVGPLLDLDLDLQ
jgi:hypothetical protein